MKLYKLGTYWVMSLAIATSPLAAMAQQSAPANPVDAKNQLIAGDMTQLGQLSQNQRQSPASVNAIAHLRDLLNQAQLDPTPMSADSTDIINASPALRQFYFDKAALLFTNDFSNGSIIAAAAAGGSPVGGVVPNDPSDPIIGINGLPSYNPGGTIIGSGIIDNPFGNPDVELQEIMQEQRTLISTYASLFLDKKQISDEIKIFKLQNVGIPLDKLADELIFNAEGKAFGAGVVAGALSGIPFISKIGALSRTTALTLMINLRLLMRLAALYDVDLDQDTIELSFAGVLAMTFYANKNILGVKDKTFLAEQNANQLGNNLNFANEGYAGDVPTSLKFLWRKFFKSSAVKAGLPDVNAALKKAVAEPKLKVARKSKKTNLVENGKLTDPVITNPTDTPPAVTDPTIPPVAQQPPATDPTEPTTPPTDSPTTAKKSPSWRSQAKDWVEEKAGRFGKAAWAVVELSSFGVASSGFTGSFGHISKSLFKGKYQGHLKDQAYQFRNFMLQPEGAAFLKILILSLNLGKKTDKFANFADLSDQRVLYIKNLSLAAHACSPADQQMIDTYNKSHTEVSRERELYTKALSMIGINSHLSSAQMLQRRIAILNEGCDDPQAIELYKNVKDEFTTFNELPVETLASLKTLDPTLRVRMAEMLIENQTIGGRTEAQINYFNYVVKNVLDLQGTDYANYFRSYVSYIKDHKLIKTTATDIVTITGYNVVPRDFANPYIDQSYADYPMNAPDPTYAIEKDIQAKTAAAAVDKSKPNGGLLPTSPTATAPGTGTIVLPNGTVISTNTGKVDPNGPIVIGPGGITPGGAKPVPASPVKPF